MKFNPVTEEELATAALLPEGIYSYQVIKAEDGISHAGNEKIDLTLKVWNDEGKEGLVFSNLSLIKLVKHFCDVNNMQDQYNTGEIKAIMCNKKSGGRVMIGIDPEKPNPNGGMYKAKNIVKDYIAASAGSALCPIPSEKKPEFIEDDLPF
jgi:hypothetical protein